MNRDTLLQLSAEGIKTTKTPCGSVNSSLNRVNYQNFCGD